MFSLIVQWNGHTWIYDDAAKGVVNEPFVMGADDFITELVRDIPNARSGVRLLFASYPFEGHTVCLVHLCPKSGGEWYLWREKNMYGWFCGHFHDYFDLAPEVLYAKAERLEG